MTPGPQCQSLLSQNCAIAPSSVHASYVMGNINTIPLLLNNSPLSSLSVIVTNLILKCFSVPDPVLVLSARPTAMTAVSSHPPLLQRKVSDFLTGTTSSQLQVVLLFTISSIVSMVSIVSIVSVSFKLLVSSIRLSIFCCVEPRMTGSAQCGPSLHQRTNISTVSNSSSSMGHLQHDRMELLSIKVKSILKSEQNTPTYSKKYTEGKYFSYF